jgi:biotin carboxyl carrier protein
MENEIKAPFDYVVKEIKVKEKQAVDKGQVVFGV